MCVSLPYLVVAVTRDSTAINHTHNFRPDRVDPHQLPQLGEDLVVKALDGVVMAREMEVVTDDGDIDGGRRSIC